MSHSKIDRRLITGGCSFSQYCWPTWADYLGRHYDQHIQAGECAVDNATVARNVMARAQSGDHVVILWTGMDRWSPFLNDKWHHTGSIVSHKQYFLDYYHPLERFITSMDYVKLIELHARDIGYKVWHFSAFPWFQGETEPSINPEFKKIFSKYAVTDFYIDDDLESFRNRLGTVLTSHKYNPKDNHPTPWHHWCWLNDIVAPRMSISIDNAMEHQVKSDNDRVLKGDVD
jgi:hypothetical protein